MSFKEAMFKAIDASDDKKVSKILLKIALCIPGVADRLQHALMEAHPEWTPTEAGPDGVAQAIDWNKMIDTLKELLPVILQIIALFKH